jgi:DNA-directed RNA polymerase specialized sigma24 family protein
MPPPVPEQLSRPIETLYRSESGRVLATLVRLLGDLDLAEEAMHEAFATALASWPQTGIPEKPRPWLISTARFKAVDGMRRRQEIRLRPWAAKSLRLQPDGGVLITDGPYLDTKEHIGGFWILKCADMDEAVAWARKGVAATRGQGEVREIFFNPSPD